MATDRIFLDFDQAGLDAQYNNRVRFPDYLEHFERWKTWSELARRELPCKLDCRFGASEVETLDIFCAERGVSARSGLPQSGSPQSVPPQSGSAQRGTPRSGSPVCVFIHGGYWYSLDKSDYSFVACGLHPHGVTTVVNNFGLAPTHDMDEIVRQNRAALAWTWRNIHRECGADPSRIFVCGHSAGGHLAMMLLATDWPTFGNDLPADLVKGVGAIGGLFDLEPIRRSYLNETLSLSAEQVRRNSPLQAEFPVSAPLLLVVGIDESEEYHRQSRSMRERWSALGYPVELTVPADLDHFNVVNQLREPDCELVRRQLAAVMP